MSILPIFSPLYPRESEIVREDARSGTLGDTRSWPARRVPVLPPLSLVVLTTIDLTLNRRFWCQFEGFLVLSGVVALLMSHFKGG